jgi:hypothetical protein
MSRAHVDEQRRIGDVREVEEKLSTLPEDPPQEAGHGELEARSERARGSLHERGVRAGPAA